MISGGTSTIYVSDMSRAVDFYSKKLGLKVTYRAGNEYCGLDAGNGFQLGLHPMSEHAPKPGTNGATIIGLTVGIPIEKAVAELTAMDVQFKGPISSDANGGISLAYFSDPDGNELYLIETKWKS